MTGQPSKLLSYARLLRLPAVFTAMADIIMGFGFVHRTWEHWPVLVVLLGASCLMYLAGMVLNDVYDLEVDRVERPQRPLPAGLIDAGWAWTLGMAMLLVGCSLGWAASVLTADARPGVIATLLASLVFLYDRILKQTFLGPAGMGGCRMLNVLLGMSSGQFTVGMLAPASVSNHWFFHPMQWLVAGGLGLYIVGVTLLARREAEESPRGPLVLALLIMGCGLGLVGWFPAWFSGAPAFPAERWQWLILIVSGLIGYRVVLAIVTPTPRIVQYAVENCLRSLILLDAVVVLFLRGPQTAFIILLLLAPAMLLRRWMYTT